jgi:glycosyltransferase involved in cell wall biosynthesis
LNGSDELVESVYRGAAAFVYPSLYEGFGLPPLEAMSAECPVVCSRAQSLANIENFKDLAGGIVRGAKARAAVG